MYTTNTVLFLGVFDVKLSSVPRKLIYYHARSGKRSEMMSKNEVTLAET